jgi:phosphoribosylformylglycinamidine synthase
MEQHIYRLYRTIGARDVKGADELCFTAASIKELSKEELDRLRLILADGFILETVWLSSRLEGPRVIEVGPRLNFATAWSSNMVSICRATGLGSIARVERFRRYLVPEDQDIENFVKQHHDRMTECRYCEPLTTFETGVIPEKVYDIDLMGNGPDVLAEIPGISMDEWDRNFYYDYFVRKHKRNPTIVEIMDLNNANSEHSRHGFFKGIQVIDGKEKEKSLFGLVRDTLEANPKGSVIAFKDNSSVIEGFLIKTLIPRKPGEPSALELMYVKYHLLLTAETHNFPTGVAPFPGAETGTGGRIRDVQGTGLGGFVGAGTAGYCVGNLRIPGYDLSWEKEYPCPSNLAKALEIEIEASNGASDYGNKFGEPLIQGFTRSFDMQLDSGERWGFLKPIMFTAGIGQIDARHTEKNEAEKGMFIVQVGGPAYRVGFGGGAASSMLQGENAEKLDFNAVQRGDAEMEQKMNRVIRACNEMGDRTIVEVIHDQGAGGPANNLKELVEKSGGWIDIRLINSADPTMSVLEIFVAEFQERNGFLIRPENIEQFKSICVREKVNCEVLGEVTGDLRFVVHDSENATIPVEIELDKLLGEFPKKRFSDNHIDPDLGPLVLPEDLTVRDALFDVLRLVSVGSKRFLTNKADRAVTGLVAQQQCCGPLQLTVSDVAVVAQSHFGLTGTATAIGEQAIKMLVNPAAGARMAIGEALTNLVSAKIKDLEEVKCSANWMWAPKLPGEGAAIRDAAEAACETMTKLGIAIDGGKDSLSMATMVDGQTVKSPRELVISLYAAMQDITKKVTSDIKESGSIILFLDFSGGRNRLGGTALAQVLGQLGNDCPDMDDPELVRDAFLAVQELIDKNLILSAHDRSDGGLIVTLLEMAFAGNCGLNIKIPGWDPALAALFSEELGLVIECREDDYGQVMSVLERADVPYEKIGMTMAEKSIIVIYEDRSTDNLAVVLDQEMQLLRQWWEETSHQLEMLQMDPGCAKEEKRVIFDRPGPKYEMPFSFSPTPEHILKASGRPKVAILRDEGSNSDREMSSAFFAAGFEPWDITMTDLLDGKIDLSGFQGLAAVGGFSYADVPESAKGWASTILFNEKLKKMFNDFYKRPDTFTLGICNGCQLFGLLGWVPWQGIVPESQPRFVRNVSGRFESRWVTAKVLESKAMMLKGMEGLVFGIHVDHGEGRLHFPDPSILKKATDGMMLPMAYVDDDSQPTERYPFNPNGSPGGLAGLCSPDGRHLAIMPHPERTFLPWQCHYLPPGMKGLVVTPWLQMFRNAYEWCINKKTYNC